MTVSVYSRALKLTFAVFSCDLSNTLCTCFKSVFFHFHVHCMTPLRSDRDIVYLPNFLSKRFCSRSLSREIFHFLYWLLFFRFFCRRRRFFWKKNTRYIISIFYQIRPHLKALIFGYFLHKVFNLLSKKIGICFFLYETTTGIKEIDTC